MAINTTPPDADGWLTMEPLPCGSLELFARPAHVRDSFTPAVELGKAAAHLWAQRHFRNILEIDGRARVAHPQRLARCESPAP